MLHNVNIATKWSQKLNSLFTALWNNKHNGRKESSCRFPFFSYFSFLLVPIPLSSPFPLLPLPFCYVSSSVTLAAQNVPSHGSNFSLGLSPLPIPVSDANLVFHLFIRCPKVGWLIIEATYNKVCKRLAVFLEISWNWGFQSNRCDPTWQRSALNPEVCCTEKRSLSPSQIKSLLDLGQELKMETHVPSCPNICYNSTYLLKYFLLRIWQIYLHNIL